LGSQNQCQVDASAKLLASVSQELEDQKSLLDKTRRQNLELNEELDMHEDYLNNRNMEIAKCQSDIAGHQALHSSLVGQHKS